MRVELPIGAFLAAALVLLPLHRHVKAHNVATVSLVAWLFFCNLIAGTNAIIWAQNTRDVLPIWCDIGESSPCTLKPPLTLVSVTKLQIGANIAVPACCLCICVHLERIASVRGANTSHAQKRRRMIYDGLACWLLPCIYMALRTCISVVNLLRH